MIGLRVPYHPDDSRMAQLLSLAVYWTLSVGDMRCFWIMLRFVVCGLLSELFCIGLEEARDIPKSESGIEPETSHTIASDLVYSAVVASLSSDSSG